MSGVEVAGGLAILSGLLQLSIDVAKASQAIQKAQMEGRDISDEEMDAMFELMMSASKAAQEALRTRSKK